MHVAEGLIVDICANVGSMWRGLPYRPRRCDIDPSLPDLDVIADPLFVSHAGKSSVWRSYATDLSQFDQLNALDQLADILDAARDAGCRARGRSS